MAYYYFYTESENLRIYWNSNLYVN